MTLGEKIQELRRKRGVSQDELAEKLDVSRQAVSKWERDEAIPETEKIIRIAQEFQVSTDYLLLSKQAQPRPEQVAAPAKTEPSAGQQVLHGVRRHGYKAGYAMLIAGAVICAIAVLIMLILPGVGSGLFDIAGGFSDSAGEMVENSGFGGVGAFDAMFGIFDQQVDQMQSFWISGTRIVALLVAGPIGLVGIALIIGGVVVTAKGRKMAQATK